MTQRYPIPEALNGLLLVLASAASGALLWGASRADSGLVVAGCAVVFSFTANTLFSLLHEAVHGSFHSHRIVNEWGGRWAAAWFPTGLSMQRAYHLTHHRNNRSPFEQFDVLHEGDVKWLKHAQWYAILTGVYWLVAVVGTVSFLLGPRILRARLLRRRDSRVAQQTASGIYLAALDEVHPVVGRLEILFSLGLQAALIVGLDLSFVGWAACYGAFALHWSSLQYADHAFSPLDAHDGAWNLRVGRITRAFFLNYHFHLAHHREPSIPWIHLPSRVDPAERQPAFWRVWLAMWRGPRRLGDWCEMELVRLASARGPGAGRPAAVEPGGSARGGNADGPVPPPGARTELPATPEPPPWSR